MAKHQLSFRTDLVEATGEIRTALLDNIVLLRLLLRQMFMATTVMKSVQRGFVLSSVGLVVPSFASASPGRMVNSFLRETGIDVN